MSSLAPVNRLRKDEIVWLSNHRCKHRHAYLEHYSCFLEEQPNVERVGFLDIEASNLDADFGIILCYCIKVLGEDKIYEDVLSPADIKKAKAGDEDKRVVRSLITDLQNFDRIVTYYGTGFDNPFIRARAVSMGLPFPVIGTVKHVDLYYTVKSKFKISRRSLENACRFLLGKTNKTKLDAKFWRAAVRGDKKALDYILDHCQHDVKDLEELYHVVMPHRREVFPSV